MNSESCKNCDAPSRKIWLISTNHYLRTVGSGVEGNDFELRQCITCGTHWFCVTYEPYNSFSYNVIWPYSSAEWNKYNTKENYIKLLEWHEFMVWKHSEPEEPKGCVIKPPANASANQILGKS